MDPLDFLAGHEPFRQLPPDTLERVGRELEILFVSKGRALFERGGTASKHLYVVRKGVVRLEVDGRLIDELGEGEAFGFPSMLADAPPAYDVVASTEALVYRLPKSLFETLLDHHDEFRRFFREGLADRLRHAVESEPPPLAGGLSTSVERLVARAPVFVPSEAKVGEAARIMRDERVSSVLVRGEPLGILTDRDLRARVLAEERGPETPVVDVMTAPVVTAPHDAPVFEVLLTLLDRRIHHLPVVREGEVIGLVTHTDLLRHQVRSPGALIKRIARGQTLEALERHAQDVAAMVESLTWTGLPATQSARLVAAVNDALIEALALRAEDELGPPPCDYAFVVFGSEGRREQLLLTDQDNALIHRDKSEEARAYFARLAEHVVEGLVEAGFPRCAGGFMATNWCDSLEAWQGHFARWLETPDPQALLEVANFFDFRVVHGALSLESLERLVLEGGKNKRFLAQLARASLRMRPPIGLFKRIREDEEGIDLKAGGIVPIVGLARVYALEAGSRERSSLSRLAAASRVGLLSKEGEESLAESFRFLTRLRLEAQLAAQRNGGSPGNRVRLSELGALDARHLKDTLLHVRSMQQALGQRFAVDMLG